MEENYVLELTLISAQGLKGPSGKLHCMQTYALAWVDSSVKLRTCVDRIGGENPTWNDKFLFKVSSAFLGSETSGISIEIYAVGVLRDTLLGTVRFLVSNFLPFGSAFNAVRTPSCCAVQVRRPSGRFHGVLNIGATVLNATDVPAMTGASAIGFRDLIGQNVHPRAALRGMKKSKSAHPISHENLSLDYDDQTNGDDSTTNPSSSPPASAALRDWNGIVRELERTKHVRSPSDGGRLFCGLGLSPRRAYSCLTPFLFTQSFNEGKLEKERSRLASQD